RGDGALFVRIVGGQFRMGCLDETQADPDDDTRPAHEVRLRGFYIQTTEATNGEIESYVEGKDPANYSFWKSKFDQRSNGGDAENSRRLPAVGIRWDLATLYAENKGGRLPTEAQWEYAARSEGKPRFLHVWDYMKTDPSTPRGKEANIALYEKT